MRDHEVGRKRWVMSSTCAPISTPGGGTANVLELEFLLLLKILEDHHRLVAGGIVEKR